MDRGRISGYNCLLIAMKRAHVHLLLDAAMFVCGVALLATGLLLAWVLPPRSRGAAVWGLTRHAWGDLHFWIAMGLLGLLAVHLALNWGWVCSVVGKLIGADKPGAAKRAAALAAVLIATAGLVAGFLLAASASVS